MGGLIDNSHRNEWRTSLRTLGLLFLLTLITLPSVGRLVGEGFGHYLAIHTSLEILAVVIAAAVFAVGWNTKKYHSDSGSLWLSCTFLGVAILDFSHFTDG